MVNSKYSGFILLVWLSFVACTKKESEINLPKETSNVSGLSIQMKHLFGSAELKDSTKYPIPSFLNDTVSIKVFKYYFSNIRLILQDSTEHPFPETYFLVDNAIASSMQLKLPQFPNGQYIGIRFLIGVDSARNVSGVQTGALDPVLGMFWTWKSGYIQAKLEGQLIGENEFIYHVGGFSGINNPLKTVSLYFKNAMTFESNKPQIITISADAAQWFYDPQYISPRTMKVVIDEGEDAKRLANNYADMFQLVSVE
jgi:hypothetical protein